MKMLSCTVHERKPNPPYTIFLLWMLFLIFLSPSSFIVMHTVEENGSFYLSGFILCRNYQHCLQLTEIFTKQNKVRKTRAVVQNEGRDLPAELTAEISVKVLLLSLSADQIWGMLPFSRSALLVAMDFPG